MERGRFLAQIVNISACLVFFGAVLVVLPSNASELVQSGDSVDNYLELTLQTEADSQPVVSFPDNLSDTISANVGETLNIPFSLSDAGGNAIGVRYVLDGRTLTAPIPHVPENAEVSVAYHNLGVSSSTPDMDVIETTPVLLSIPVGQDIYSSGWVVSVAPDDPSVVPLIQISRYDRDLGVLEQISTYETEGGVRFYGYEGEYLVRVAILSGNDSGTVPDAPAVGAPKLKYSNLCSKDQCQSGGYTVKLISENDYWSGYGYGYGTETTSYQENQYLVRYSPIVQMDWRSGYNIQREAYVWSSEDVGTHSLEVVVDEQTSDGVRSVVAKTFNVDVTQNIACDAPSIKLQERDNASVYLSNSGYGGWPDTIYSLSSHYEYDYQGRPRAIWRWLGVDFSVEYKNRNFRPLVFEASAPGGIYSVQIENNIPVGERYVFDGEGYSPLVFTVNDFLWSADGRQFVLHGEDSYRELLNEGVQTLTVRAVSNCGAMSTLDVPLDIRLSPKPQVSIQNIGGAAVLEQGDQSISLELNVSDPGRGLLGVAAVLVPVGWSPADAGFDPVGRDMYGYMSEIGTVIGSHKWYKPAKDPIDAGYYSYSIGTPDNVIDRDDYLFRLPVAAYAPEGNYDLRIITQEIDGRLVISEPVPATVVPSKVGPRVELEYPNYPIAAGEVFTVNATAYKLGEIDRINIEFRDEAGAVIQSQTLDMKGVGNPSAAVNFTMPSDAKTGDQFVVATIAYDTAGMSAQAEAGVSATVWGGATTEVTGTQWLGLDVSYSNVVVKSGGKLTIATAVPIYSLTIEDGGEVTVSVPLSPKQLLEIKSGGVLKASPSNHNYYYYHPQSARGGRHGGDADATNPAYDDYRYPRYAGGASINPSSTSYILNGGGVIEIDVPELIVNGTLSADGRSVTEMSASSQSYYSGSGAGGSVLVHTTHVSGNGTISANGGAVTYSGQWAGAGGRIAIYYDVFSDGTGTLQDSLHLKAISGASVDSSTTGSGGAGTIYLKKSEQQYGDLIVDSGGLYGTRSSTTLRSIGRYRITAAGLMDGSTNQYFVEASDASWPTRNDYYLEKGLVGLYVSLDADNPEALLYEVVGNTGNRLIVVSETPLDSIVGKDLVGVMRFDQFIASDGVKVLAKDRIYANEFQLDDPEALAEVSDLYTDQVTNIDQLTLDGQNGFYVGNIHLGSLTVNNGTATFRGLVDISGEVSMTAATLQADRVISVGGDLSIDGSSRLIGTGVNVHGNTVINGAQLELALTDAFHVDGNMSVTGNSVVTVPSADIQRKRYYEANIEAIGNFVIEAGSSIDVTGRGLPVRYAFPFESGGVYGTHVGPGYGQPTMPETLVYGDFRGGGQPGGGGYYDAGGGVIQLHAGLLQLNGSLLANAQVNGGGAGGSVSIVSDGFEGDGVIEVNGTDRSSQCYSCGAGSGGRITVKSSQAATFAGTMVAYGGLGGNSASYPDGAAGTIYIEEAGNKGHLRIESNGRQYKYPTILRNVGRHTIAGSPVLVDGLCHITVNDTGLTTRSQTKDGRGLSGLWVDLNADTREGPYYEIVDNDASTIMVKASAGLCPAVGTDLIGVIPLERLTVSGEPLLPMVDRFVINTTDGLDVDEGSTLEFNDLIVAGQGWEQINWPAGTHLHVKGEASVGSLTVNNWSLEAEGALRVQGNLSISGPGSEVKVNSFSVGGAVHVSNVPADVILDGVYQLGAANTTDSVHHYYFDIPQTGYYWVGVGGIDHDAGYMLLRTDANGTVDAANTVRSEWDGYPRQLNLTVGRYVLLVGGGYFTQAEALAGVSDVGGITYWVGVRKSPTDTTWGTDVSPYRVRVGQIDVEGDFVLDGAVISALNIQAGGNVTLNGGSRLGMSFGYRTWSESLEPLTVAVPNGTLTVGPGSEISVAGSGYRYTGYCYQAGYYGADAVGNSSVYLGYGDWTHPDLSGNCSDSLYQMAGAAMTLSASRILNDGVIDASADIASRSAGGSIFVDVGVIEGTGLFLAQGGNRNGGYSLGMAPAGSGGRISVVYDDMSAYGGTISAAGGLSSRYGTSSGTYSPTISVENTGGAGSVYLRQHAASEGELVINNTEARTGQLRATTSASRLRSVGRHTISAVEPIGDGRIKIAVEGTPWSLPADTTDGLGLVGLKVDLDSSSDAGTLFEIVDNGNDYIVLDDVQAAFEAIVGNELVGVVPLSRIEVSGGARFATDDRISVGVSGGIAVAQGTTLFQVGQLTSWEDVAWPQGMTLAMNGNQLASALTVDNWSLLVDGDMSVAGGFAISGDGSVVQANTFSVGGDALISGARVKVKSFILPSGNLTMVDATSPGGGVLPAVLAPLDPTQTATFPLTVDVSGVLSMYGSSHIDGDGKGYYGGTTYGNQTIVESSYAVGGSHAGFGGKNANVLDDRSPVPFGDYQHAKHPGGGGRYGSNLAAGGGAIRVKADSLNLNDNSRITADGAVYNTYYTAGAGGSVDILVNSLNGSSSSKITANGGSANYASGSGGRVHIASVSDAFTGAMSARGGYSSPVNQAGSAGTVYRNSKYSDIGTLSVSNRDPISNQVTMSDRVTNLEAIGRHKIVAVTQGVEPDTWLVDLELPVNVETKVDSLAEGVAYNKYPVTVRERTKVHFEVAEESGSAYPVYAMLFRGGNPDALTVGDALYSYAVRSTDIYLDKGDYTLVVGRTQFSQLYAVSDTANQTAAVSFTMSIGMDSGSQPIPDDRDPAGYMVDLDDSDHDGPYYLVLRKDSGSRLVVQTSTDISGSVGKMLTGVHQFARLEVKDNAVVDFGDDWLVVPDSGNFVVDDNAEVRVRPDVNLASDVVGGIVSGSWKLYGDVAVDGVVVGANKTLRITGSLTSTQGTSIGASGVLEVGGSVAVDGPLTLATGSTFTAAALTADSVSATNARMEVQDVHVSGDMSLASTSVLTVPWPTASPVMVPKLTVDVGGSLVIADQNSGIDLNGKGYPLKTYFANDLNHRSCHGGQRSDSNSANKCVYGYYEKAEFAGSSDNYNYSGTGTDYGNGGGLGRIVAGQLELHGYITANGTSYSYNSGAGGGLDFVLGAFSGSSTGRIEAKGARTFTTSSSYGSAGGGRISVSVPDDANLFTGKLNTAGGAYNASYNIAGAGTVYVGPDGQPGDLTIDNGGYPEALDGTPIKSIGPATITAVSELGVGRWEISVGDNQEIHSSGSARLTGKSGDAIDQYQFQLAESRTVHLRFNADFRSAVLIVSLPNFSLQNYYMFYSYTGGSLETDYSLPAGTYVLAVVSDTNASTYNVMYPQNYSSVYAGNYSYSLDTYGGAWRPTDLDRGAGIQGLEVDLDASSTDGPYYRILSNSDNSFVIESTDPLDPAQLVGKQLIGVHRLHRLNVTNGGSVDFMGDRVLVEDLTGSTISGSVSNAEAGSVLP